MEPKKYESVGVDKDKQQAEPTLVEKAQKEEAKARANKPSGALVPAQKLHQALQQSTTNHQDYVNGPRETGSSQLENVLTNGNWSQEELQETTTGPSKTADGQKVSDQKKEEK